MTNTNTNAVAKVSKLKPAQLKRWARENRELAEKVLVARTFAELERIRVAAYIEPIFERFGFRDEDTGEVLKESRLAYLAGEDPGFADYYAACDRAHREHGFEGEPDECPALVAENDQHEAEQALLNSMGALVGVEGVDFCRTLELRAKALEWALNVCAMSLENAR